MSSTINPNICMRSKTWLFSSGCVPRSTRPLVGAALSYPLESYFLFSAGIRMGSGSPRTRTGPTNSAITSSSRTDGMTPGLVLTFERAASPASTRTNRNSAASHQRPASWAAGWQLRTIDGRCCKHWTLPRSPITSWAAGLRGRDITCTPAVRTRATSAPRRSPTRRNTPTTCRAGTTTSMRRSAPAAVSRRATHTCDVNTASCARSATDSP